MNEEVFLHNKVEAETSSFDRNAWEQLKEGAGPASIIAQGRTVGVPEAELVSFAEERFKQAWNLGNYGLEYRLRTNMPFGNPAEALEAGRRAYEQYMLDKNYGEAICIAVGVFGKDSDEWRKANDATGGRVFSEWGDDVDEGSETASEGDVLIELSSDATLADLFNASPSEEWDDVFWSEIHDNFNPEVSQALDALTDEQMKVTNMLSFFDSFGYSAEDVEVFLPIQFKKR